ncbi:programmed cell death protein 2-like [Lingula anatina]|uniref:Programmed cell death protein 2-like n=1 Tax=Lingula anatina TaxID=7574 RepID=A0A1S3HHN6_LINAN|nr:programmed cell death protein 2-like [Lingula anatina]|eukprot:XP_013384996.1 programmed cell death protein 2-like [Lingula anatina]
METVLLGVCDEEVGEGDVTDWKTNKFGGNPDFPSNVEPPTPVCELCGKRLLLVTQLYCPLQGSLYHRTMYIFGCVTKTCWNKSESWKVLRVQQLDNGASETHQANTTSDWDVSKETVVMATTDWCDDADDWGVAKVTCTMATTDWCDDADDWGTSHNTYTDSVVSTPPNIEKDLNKNTPNLSTEAESDELASNMKTLHLQASPSESNRSYASVARVTSPVMVAMETDPADSVDSGVDSVQCIAEEFPAVDWDNVLSVLATGSTTVQITGQTTDQITSGEMTAAHGTVTDDGRVTKDPAQSTITADSSPGICFKPYYVNVFEENEVKVSASDLDSDLDHIQQLLKAYSSQEGVSVDAMMDDGDDRSAKVSGRKVKVTGGKVKVTESGDGYEKVKARHGDVIFEKFKKRISLCPQQCIRYQWAGEPLYISQALGSSWKCPPCQSCGSPRVFELQLLPTLVNVLRIGTNKETSVEFGTVLVFTCKKACWSNNDVAVQEAVHVQADPDSDLFRH